MREVTWPEPPVDDPGWSELPDVIPDWALEEGALPEAPPCDCDCPGRARGDRHFGAGS